MEWFYEDVQCSICGNNLKNYEIDDPFYSNGNEICDSCMEKYKPKNEFDLTKLECAVDNAILFIDKSLGLINRIKQEIKTNGLE